MNPKVIFTAGAVALLLGATCLLGLHRAGSLPRIRLSNGGEFRVLKVCYGTENDHHLGGAPNSFFWAWNHLPKHLQRVIPYPDAGVSGLSPVAGKPAVSIWYADIDPRTGKPLLGPADYALITLDSGERLSRVWPEPADDYRQIFLHDPPRHSKYLHVELGAEYDPVAFSVVNPAFSGANAEKTNQRETSRNFPPVELEVRCDGYDQGGGGLFIRFPDSLSLHRQVKGFEFEYSIVNLHNTDLFVVVEPKDNVADSHPVFHGDGAADENLKQYALVPRPRETNGKWTPFSAKRKAWMALRNPLETGGRFHLCIYVEGRFGDTGQPFYGSTYIDLPVAIID